MKIPKSSPDAFIADSDSVAGSMKLADTSIALIKTRLHQLADIARLEGSLLPTLERLAARIEASGFKQTIMAPSPSELDQALFVTELDLEAALVPPATLQQSMSTSTLDGGAIWEDSSEYIKAPRKLSVTLPGTLSQDPRLRTMVFPGEVEGRN